MTPHSGTSSASGAPAGTSLPSERISNFPFIASEELGGKDSQCNDLLFPWTDYLHYAFPHFLLFLQVLCKVPQDRVTVILKAPFWLHQFRFTDLINFSTCIPLCLGTLPDLLTQDQGQL